MTGWPFDGAPKRVRLDADLYDHAKAGEPRPAEPARDTVLVDQPLRMVGADRGRIEDQKRPQGPDCDCR
jgi:hypothetical protein